MKRAPQLLGVAAAGLLASACASHLTSQSDSAAILAQGPQSQSSNEAAMAGRTAMAWGDSWTAQRLFRRAEAGHDSPSNRFNVATGYESTGRLADAAAIYRTLLVDGRYTWVTSGNDIHNPNARTRRFNIADEHARQLDVKAATLRGAETVDGQSTQSPH